MKFLGMVDAKEYGNTVHLRILTRSTYMLFRNNFKHRSNVFRFGGWSMEKDTESYRMLIKDLNE